MIEEISVVIIAHNAQTTLLKTLDSLKAFQEVIVYENNSTDATAEIASSFANVRLVHGEFEGFGKTKNKAASFASNDWILSLDSDEVLSDEFTQNLRATTLQNGYVYKIRRRNYYKEHAIRYCWKEEHISRLYNKKETAFKELDVHEYIISDGLKTVLLDGIIQHYPYTSIEDFLIKANRYSTLFAMQNKGVKHSSPTKAFLNGSYSFVKTYILRRGFLDGYVGLIIACTHAVTNFYKYIKLYEANKEV